MEVPGANLRPSVGEIQSVLQRFFHASDNATKMHLEGVLKGIRESDAAWRDAQSWLSTSNDAYVQWFGAAVLEETVRPHRWARLSPAERQALRDCVFGFLRARYAAIPGFVGVKLAKVAVIIGKADYPHGFPEFFAYLLALARDDSSRLLGLNLITIACEEFADTRGQSLAGRRKELKLLFQQQMPAISSEWRDQLKKVTRDHLRHIPIEIPDTIPHAVKSYISPVRYEASFDRAGTTIVKVILEGITQAISWLSPSDVLGSGLFETVLPLAMLQDETGAQAIGLLGDLLERNYVPSDFQTYMGVLFRHSFSLLYAMSTIPASTDTPEVYFAKCNHFLWQFVNNYFGRIQRSDAFPAVELLSLYFRYTFAQRSPSSFLACVDTWAIILNSFGEPGQEADPTINARFGPAIEELASRILRASSFSENGPLLRGLDTTSRSEDGETEQDAFLRKCRDLTIRAAEFFPRRLLQPLASSFATAGSKFVAKVSAESPPYSSREWVELTKDLGGLATIMGGITSHFISHPETAGGVLELIKQFKDLTALIVQRSLHKQNVPFDELLAQLFAALGALIPWVEVQTGSNIDSENSETRRQAVLLALAPSLDVLAGFLSLGATEHSTESALGLLDAIALAVRLPQLAQIPGVQWLLGNAHVVAAGLSVPFQSRLYAALASILLLPYKIPTTSTKDEQHWEERTVAFHTLMRPLTDQLAGALNITEPQQLNHPESITRLHRTLSAMASATKRIGERGGKESKQILMRVFEGAVRAGVPLLRAFLPQRQMAVVEGVTELYIALFETFKAHLGAVSIQEIMMAFIGVLGGEIDNLRTTFISSDAAATSVAERFLCLIEHVVRDSSLQLRNLIVDIRAFLFALPHAQLQGEVAHKYYEVLYALVLEHWKSFDSKGGQSVLMPSLNLFCEALRSGRSGAMDVTVMVEILKWIRDLGKRVKIFERQEFVQTPLRWQFAALMLDLATAVHGGAPTSLSEEAGEVLYDLALANFGSFFQELLPAWIEQQELSPEQKRHLRNLFSPSDTDLTSFLLHLRDISTDMAFFRLCNSPPPQSLS